MNILSKIKVHPFTYMILLISFLGGLIKSALILFGIVMIHEFGHVIMCTILGYRIKEITILPFGGITSIKKEINSSIKDDFLIAISGVLFQYIVVSLVLLTIDNPYTYQIIYNYNILICLFNMIPIIPLDGYKILKGFLEIIMSYKLSNIMGIILSLINIVVFIFLNQIYKFDNYTIIYFLIYKVLDEYRLMHEKQNRFYLERVLKDYNFRKVRIINSTKLSNMKKRFYHIFIKNGNFYKEEDVLAKKYGIFRD